MIVLALKYNVVQYIILINVAHQVHNTHNPLSLWNSEYGYILDTRMYGF